MINTNNEIPLINKIAQFMVAIISIVFVLYIGAEIILPVVFSFLIAILLNPIVNFLYKKKIPRVLAICIVILLCTLIIACFFFFLISQASLFWNMLPELKVQFKNISQQIILWLSNNIKISTKTIEDWFLKAFSTGTSNISTMVGQTIINISSALITAFLIPIYIFLILYYKPLFLDFITKIFAKEKHQYISAILFDSKKLIQSYLLGLLIESALISVLNIIGLLIIGVDFAIVIGIIGGLLNIIPYIGGMVAVIIPMLIALTTLTPVDALWVLLVYVIVQFIDNNILMYLVVSSKVKINALASIIVVLIGSAIWGVPGMFLAIPLTAIIKVILDRVEDLKPFGALLGDTMPIRENTLFKRFRSKNK